MKDRSLVDQIRLKPKINQPNMVMVSLGPFQSTFSVIEEVMSTVLSKYFFREQNEVLEINALAFGFMFKKNKLI